jgi:hypothetical protein
MAAIETQQVRMLEQLRQAGRQPMTLDQLRAGGIDFPAVVIGELELNGYVIEPRPRARQAPRLPTGRDRSFRSTSHPPAPPLAPPTVAIATPARSGGGRCRTTVE